MRMDLENQLRTLMKPKSSIYCFLMMRLYILFYINVAWEGVSIVSGKRLGSIPILILQAPHATTHTRDVTLKTPIPTLEKT